MFSEHPASFTNMINNLSASFPEPKGLGKSRHVCSKQEDQDLYDWNTASEHETKAEHIKDLPPVIKTIVEENLKVFKSDLEPSDCIDLAQIPGYEGYEKGIKLDIIPGVKHVANHSKRQVLLHYAAPAHKMYQDLIDQEVVRKFYLMKNVNGYSHQE